jgi:hypothetical protein
VERCEERAAELERAHGWLLGIARLLEPTPVSETGRPPTGAEVRQRVEAYLAQVGAVAANGGVSEWLRGPVEHMRAVLLRLGDWLYRCYDVPGLPRTNNDLEQFYRRLKAGERRISGHRRSDGFVVRVGEFAVYAVAANGTPEAELQRQLATVPPAEWQRERRTLRANQERQAKMRRFRLHRDAYLADLEARWAQLNRPP